MSNTRSQTPVVAPLPASPPFPSWGQTIDRCIIQYIRGVLGFSVRSAYKKEVFKEREYVVLDYVMLIIAYLTILRLF